MQNWKVFQQYLLTAWDKGLLCIFPLRVEYVGTSAHKLTQAEVD